MRTEIKNIQSTTKFIKIMWCVYLFISQNNNNDVCKTFQHIKYYLKKTIEKYTYIKLFVLWNTLIILKLIDNVYNFFLYLSIITHRPSSLLFHYLKILLYCDYFRCYCFLNNFICWCEGQFVYNRIS